MERPFFDPTPRHTTCKWCHGCSWPSRDRSANHRPIVLREYTLQKNQDDLSAGALGTAPQPALTLAMIVRDGGRNLASLLEEARPHVDHILVGDTGSRDGSRAVAESLGARILDVPWQDDFAAARNAVLDACPEGWVLILDADERMAPDDWRGLFRWCRGNDPLIDPAGMVLATRNYLHKPDHRGWRPVPANDVHALPGGAPADGYVVSRKVRLFPARTDIRFRGLLHETVESDLALAGLPLRTAPWPVHHFGMLETDPDKPRRYLLLARRKVEAEPRNPGAWSELVDCAVACGRDAEAFGAVECGLALDPDHPDLNISGSDVLERLGRPEDADRLLARVAGPGRATRQQRATASHAQARLALTSGRIPEAGPHILQSLRLDPGDPNALNTLGVWHLLRGDHVRAERVLRRAAVRLPGSAEPRLNLGRLYLREGRWEKARLWLEGALKVNPECTGASDALRRLPECAEEAAAP